MITDPGKDDLPLVFYDASDYILLRTTVELGPTQRAEKVVCAVIACAFFLSRIRMAPACHQSVCYQGASGGSQTELATIITTLYKKFINSYICRSSKEDSRHYIITFLRGFAQVKLIASNIPAVARNRPLM